MCSKYWLYLLKVVIPSTSMYIDVFMLTNRPAKNAHALMQGKSGSKFVVANNLANDKSWGLMELTFT